ncbi:MAG: hypothetical protein WCG75_07825 [Armatimonadota bacterium]
MNGSVHISLDSIKSSGGNSRDWRTCEANNLVGNADPALVTGIALEDGKDYRRDNDGNKGDSVLGG